ncbi:ribosomal RNA small subunit methyltransferase NEP1 [Brachionus plicatilis]|uniref:Ribosomal RNA small subunit methyltransferase NEP1 n=1 Tax=Brachionus plicatilis TaxID=10195 RepID=A0A3M7SWK2_BRAPC|nr:ribosomal RNA small subunit methyltransferase NEP1 [Brachionus plicatilis]
MKNSKNSEENENCVKRLKTEENSSGHSESEFDEHDDITSTLQLENDLKTKITKNPFARKETKRLIVVLENACLETVKVGKIYELLNCDRHKQYIIKHKKDPSQCRPDILHQCLLMLFDSPLNRANLLQVYVHSQKNVLIEINPQTRIPRTFDRFSGLMVQLLHKLSIRAADTSQKLIKVIKNPITDHLPVGCPKYTMSFHAEKVVNVSEFATNHPDEQPVVVVIGAMAKGSVDVDYTDKMLSISNYPLSAAITCSKFCTAFEDKWKIL